MEVTTTTNQSITFSCRDTTESSFTITYVKEGADTSTDLVTSGTYLKGRLSFSLTLTLDPEQFYMFYVSDSTREVCRHKVYVTNQDVTTFSIDDGVYESQASSGDEFITLD